MKFLAVFVAVFAVAVASPLHATWTLQDLSEAIQSPSTDPALIPYLEDALNQMMTSLYAGGQIESTAVSAPAAAAIPTTWSVEELSQAIQDPKTDAALLPYLNAALDQLMSALYAGEQSDSIVVAFPATSSVLTSWTLYELSEAIQNPSTDPALLPYLNNALNQMMAAAFAGEAADSIIVALPAIVAPVVAPVSPVPAVNPVAVVAPSEVAPIEAEVSAEASPAAPLVQIILNVNQA